MSRQSRPMTEMERERIPIDAEILLAHLRMHAFYDRRGVRVVVAPREQLARELSLTVHQIARAEDRLLSEKKITVDRLIPRNEREAARPPMYLYRPLKEAHS